MPAKQAPHRPGIVRAAGLRARAEGFFIVSQTDSQWEDSTMTRFLLEWLSSRASASAVISKGANVLKRFTATLLRSLCTPVV